MNLGMGISEDKSHECNFPSLRLWPKVSSSAPSPTRFRDLKIVYREEQSMRYWRIPRLCDDDSAALLQGPFPFSAWSLYIL